MLQMTDELKNSIQGAFGLELNFFTDWIFVWTIYRYLIRPFKIIREVRKEMLSRIIINLDEIYNQFTRRAGYGNNKLSVKIELKKKLM